MARVLAIAAVTAASCAGPAPVADRIVATPHASAGGAHPPMTTERPLVPLRSPVVRAEPRPAVSQRPEPLGATVRMSWYTMGTRTASGEAVQPHALNCAGARRWPLGHHLTLRNPENDARTTVRINDRGGFESRGRALDCMPAVWRALAIPLARGVATVEVVG